MLTKNAKTISSLTFFIISSSSLFFLSNFFSIRPLIYDMITSYILKTTQPASPELPKLLLRLKQDVSDFITVEWIYAFISALSSFLLTTATLITSTESHHSHDLSGKQLFLSAIRSIQRPFYTWFYTIIFIFGYNFFVFSNLVPVLLIVRHPLAWRALYGTIVILAVILYTCLAVVWKSGYVVSLIEERSGIEAPRKGGELVRIVKLHGFFLNFVYLIAYYVLMQGIRFMFLKESSVFHVCVWLVVLNCVRINWMLSLMALVVFYYKCKKAHGEEVELQVSFDYAKIPTPLFVNESLP